MIFWTCVVVSVLLTALVALLWAGRQQHPWWETLTSRYERRQHVRRLTKGMPWGRRQRFLNYLASERRKSRKEPGGLHGG